MLTKSDPNQNKCKVCKLNSSANCKRRSVVYQMKYQGCTGRNLNDGLYIGDTAGSIGERIGEHLNKYEIKDKKSVFHKHIGESRELIKCSCNS